MFNRITFLSPSGSLVKKISLARDAKYTAVKESLKSAFNLTDDIAIRYSDADGDKMALDSDTGTSSLHHNGMIYMMFRK